MKTNKYLENVKQGKNSWKAYILTILTLIGALIISSRGLSLLKVQPFFKSFFSNDNLAKNIYVDLLIAGVFGIALMVFIIAFKKFHKRSFASLSGIQKRFNIGLYLKGFITWGILIFIGGLITDYPLFKNFYETFKLSNFILLFLFGFISIGIQSFFEEILIRGYILQGLSLKVKLT